MNKKIVLVGGTVLKACLDNGCFKNNIIVAKYFGMSPISLGETKRTRNVPKERLTLLQRYDVNNDFNGFLSKNKADFVFVDLQKSIADLLMVNGQYCTNQPSSGDTFYAENQDSIEHVTDYKPEKYFDKLDRFADTILKYYSPDSIILLSSFVPRFYTAGKYVRTHKNIFKHNDWYDAFESRFQSRTGCIYYNKSRFYFNEKRSGKPIKYSIFEQEFFDEAKSDFEKIINHKTFSKVPSYSYSVKRYAKLCNTLDKKCFDVFLDKKDAVDRFLLSCPPEFCLKNCGDFELLKIPKRFFGAKPRKKFRKTFAAFLSAEACTDFDIKIKDSELLFSNGIRVKPLLEAVRSTAAVRYKKQVNFFNYGYFYNQLFPDKQLQQASPELPEVVDVAGTCISRFIFNFNEKDFSVNNFAFHYVPIMTDIPAKYDKSIINENNWDERMLKLQCDCGLEEFLSRNKAPWFVCDLFTLTALTAFLINGKPVCMMGRGFAKEHKFENIEISKRFDDDFIISELKKFVKMIKRLYGDNIILVKSRRQIYKVDDTGKIVPYTNEKVNSERNQKNDIYNKAFQSFANCYYVDIADQFLSDDHSFVTLSPAHFEEECYLEEGKIIKYIIKNKPKQKIFDDYSPEVRLNRILRFKRAGNSSEALEKLFFRKVPDKYIIRFDSEDIAENFDFLLNLYEKNYASSEELKNDPELAKHKNLLKYFE